MEKFRFLKWQVYTDAKELFSLVLRIVRKLPKEYRYGLGSQIIRSGFSVVLNIAEGGGKNSDKELNRFIDIALGSLYETLAGVDVMKGENLINAEEFDKVYGKIEKISSQLGGFKKRLSR